MNTTNGATHDDGMTIERRVGQQIHAFSNMISGFFYSRTEQPLGITLPEWRVLRSVLLSPGTSQGEVALAEGLNVMNVSRAVGGLKRKGLVDSRPDEDDRRRTLLTATPVGEEMGLEIGQREALIYEHVFSVLAEDEVGELADLLNRVNTALRTTELPDPPPVSRDWAALMSDRSA